MIYLFIYSAEDENAYSKCYVMFSSFALFTVIRVCYGECFKTVNQLN